jgi:hypothetical protein
MVEADPDPSYTDVGIVQDVEHPQSDHWRNLKPLLWCITLKLHEGGE